MTRPAFWSSDHRTIPGARRYVIECGHGPTRMSVLEAHDRAWAHGRVVREHVRHFGCDCVTRLPGARDPTVRAELEAVVRAGGREPGARPD